jgi:hypothetical protein
MVCVFLQREHISINEEGTREPPGNSSNTHGFNQAAEAVGKKPKQWNNELSQYSLLIHSRIVISKITSLLLIETC